MLNTYIQLGHVRTRYLSTPIGPYYDGFVSWLEERGFARSTIGLDLGVTAAFGEYLLDRGVTELLELTDRDIEDFLEWYLARPRQRGPARRTPGGSVSLRETLVGSLREIFAYLRTIGAMPPPQPAEASRPPYDAVTVEYLAFLAHHRGFAPRTIEIHRSRVEAFFVTLALQKPLVALEVLTTRAMEEVFLEMSEGRGSRSQQIMTSTLEALLGYLRSNGNIPEACRPFLPRRRSYALAALPTAIPWEQVQHALESIDRSTALGKRDYAVFLILATSGLRSGELCDLALEDID